MIGYPYSYGNDKNDNSNQDEKFMIFSLDPVSEDSELDLINLINTVRIGASEFQLEPILSSQFSSELGDQFSYQLCDQISQVCARFEVVPGAKTLVLDYNGFCKYVTNSDGIISTISSELGITKISAMEQAENFFKTKNVVVQAGGLHGAIYTVGSYLQSAGSAGLVTRTLGLAKVAGVNGLRILQAQPALAIAIPTTGAMFFYGCGAVAGNNTVGKVLVTTGDILALPMKGVEVLWNSYVNPVIYKVFGIPTILNMTQTFKTGPGYTVKEISKYIPLNKTSLLESAKDTMIEVVIGGLKKKD